MDQIAFDGQALNGGEINNGRKPYGRTSFYSRHCSKTRMAGLSFLGLAVLIALVIVVISLTTADRGKPSHQDGGKSSHQDRGNSSHQDGGDSSHQDRGNSSHQDGDKSSHHYGGDSSHQDGGKSSHQDDKAPIHVGAFNIQHFGRSLMSNDLVVSRIIKIFQGFDVMLVQEVRDSSNTALRDLNTSLAATGETWNFVSSGPLGRSKYYQEQYVFFYKVLSVSYLETHQTDDSSQDVYEREPFSVEFEYTSVSKKSKQRVVLMALHTKPASAKKELQHFSSTIKTVAGIFPQAVGVIALGDLNADCNYLSKKARGSLEIFNSKEFVSLISDAADTAVSRKSDCAYDRVILYGDKIDARNGSVFNFETVLELNEEEAAEISDHYPVQFTLY